MVNLSEFLDKKLSFVCDWLSENGLQKLKETFESIWYLINILIRDSFQDLLHGKRRSANRDSVFFCKILYFVKYYINNFKNLW